MDPATLDNISKLGPIATALAAVVALIVGIIAVTQKSKADRRDQWWKRAQSEVVKLDEASRSDL